MTTFAGKLRSLTTPMFSGPRLHHMHYIEAGKYAQNYPAAGLVALGRLKGPDNLSQITPSRKKGGGWGMSCLECLWTGGCSMLSDESMLRRARNLIIRECISFVESTLTFVQVSCNTGARRAPVPCNYECVPKIGMGPNARDLIPSLRALHP